MAGLVRSAADQEMRRSLRDAERALRHAADICGRMIQGNRKEGKDRSDSRRALDTQVKLERILGQVMTIGHITPLSFDDNDLISEADRNRLAREKRTKERAATQVHEAVDGTEE